MKKSMILIPILLLIFWGCKSPISPDIEEALKKADIRIEIDSDSIGYNNHDVEFIAVFKEKNGIGAELENLWMLIYCGDEFWNKSLRYMCPKTLRANGELELDFNFYTGSDCYAIEVNAKFIDENENEHHIKKKFAVSK